MYNILLHCLINTVLLKNLAFNMSVKKILSKIGVSWHDVFVVLLIFETCWWGMFAFMDGADFVIRIIAETSKTEYHVYVLVQKCISILKLTIVIALLWYGTIFLGKANFVRGYFILGIIIDTILMLSWIVISTEESWPLSPVNIYGIHYVVTFIFFRVVVYSLLYGFIRNVFVSAYGPPAVGTMNGTVVGIPEQGYNGNNLAFLGKGFKAMLDYYRVEVEKAFLIALIWDVLWNVAIIFSQELPELLFNFVLIGMLGSLPLNISSDDLALRFVRVILGLVAIYIVMKKQQLCLKIWIGLYTTVIVVNAVLLAYLSTSAAVDDTASSNAIMCTVFFASNVAKCFVLYCSLRFYYHLRKTNMSLITQNNNV